jgi:hypothetical protein
LFRGPLFPDLTFSFTGRNLVFSLSETAEHLVQPNDALLDGALIVVPIREDDDIKMKEQGITRTYIKIHVIR